MRTLLFGIALSAATVIATSSFAAEAVCAMGFTASPRMINASEDYGQSYTCTGAKTAPKLVCSSEFNAQGQSGSNAMSSMAMKDEQIVYTCAEPATPPK
ncbi:MAG TPA: hypothetical protein VMD53_11020 [Rhizomicrobium sp.]|nr:hypothetical protein [Rhizomicrobium sp.]